MLQLSTQIADIERKKNDLLLEIKSLDIEVNVGKARYATLEDALYNLQTQQQLEMQGVSESQAIALGNSCSYTHTYIHIHKYTYIHAYIYIDTDTYSYLLIYRR